MKCPLCARHNARHWNNRGEIGHAPCSKGIHCLGVVKHIIRYNVQTTWYWILSFTSPLLPPINWRIKSKILSLIFNSLHDLALSHPPNTSFLYSNILLQSNWFSLFLKLIFNYSWHTIVISSIQQWLDIYIFYKVITIILVPIWHHT